MKRYRVQAYVGAVTVLAIGAVALQDWDVLAFFSVRMALGFCALLILGLLSESLTLSIHISRSSPSTSSIIFLPLLSSVLLFGPEAAVLFIAVTGVAGEFLIRKKERIRAIFNSSQYVLSTSVAGWVYSFLGGQALAFHEARFSESISQQLLAFIGFGLVFVLLNHGAVSLAISLSEGTRIRKVWHNLVGKSGSNLYYDILVSPIAIAVAFLYLELWILGLFLIVLPLLFIRHAFLTILQLQQANRDLLTALVKAIETRDPYTSGHALRVASLGVRIGESMGLSEGKQKHVEMAALLHDIGKIEAVYSEILSKPSDLTPQEREIIESHVSKGVELLERLSSFPKEVVEGVRGHHERLDGKGYPDGLIGDQIPLSARIIKVCDAIDAMLSDRPYRSALSLEQVREQLAMYSGSQFDENVVKVAVASGLLEAHESELRLQREVARREVDSGWSDGGLTSQTSDRVRAR